MFALDVRAAEHRWAHGFIGGLIDQGTSRRGASGSQLGDLRSQDLHLAKTADRRVLGCMNDMAFACESSIEKGGSVLPRRHRRAEAVTALAYQQAPAGTNTDRAGTDAARSLSGGAF